jgi:DNA end-binding protein Ku
VAADDYVGEEAGGGGGSLRPFWSGTITFGLVSVPVALFPANRPRSVSLRMVAEEGTPLQRRYVCPKEEKEIGWDEIVRGYEVSKGKFVVIKDEELEALEPRKSRDIDLRLFVDRDEIPPLYYERAYYLTPAAGSNKAYRLLAEVMERKSKAGIATFVMRGKEYLVAIIAEKGILRAETLRFEDEVRKPEDVGLPKVAKAKDADVKKFEREIGKRAGKLKLAEFLDDRAERLQEVAEKKRKKGEDVVKVDAPREEEEEGGEVIDILAALRRSLGEDKPARTRTGSGKKSRAKRPAKRTASKKRKPAAKRRKA